MSRTLQKILLVAAVTSAPSVAMASPDTHSNRTPAAWTQKSEEGGFFQRMLARAKARHEQEGRRTDDRATNQKPAAPGAIDKLPAWLQRMFDRDERPAATRSTGS